ncbi:MAG: hypothetical protein MUC81_10680 [Bacteroidia bacterium]|jgi:hypothetical protein|nr:hypothetical protein [Bacteroidia bacterium]
MNLTSRIFIWFLSAVVLTSTIGVPITKMICKLEDGKVVISLTEKQAACNHNETHQTKHDKKKSCCEAPEQSNASENCCDFSHKLLQLKEPSLVQKQFTLLAIPMMITNCFPMIIQSNLNTFPLFLDTHVKPPNLQLQSSNLTFIQQFLI